MGTGEGILVMLGGVLLAAAGACGMEYEVVIQGPGTAWLAACDGQHAGYADILAADLRCYPHAALWLDAARSMVDLNPSGCQASRILDVSEGRQVGIGDDLALLWSGTPESVVALHPSGFDCSCAYGIWGKWQVGAGTSSVLGEHALLWSGTAASVVDLHPVGFAASRAGGVWGNRQVGYGVPQTDSNDISWRALLWSGTAESVVNLHPAGFRWSCASDTWGVWQVGSGVPDDGDQMRALLWCGTAESVVNLHPSGCRSSYVVRCWGDRQVGVGGDHALLWSGTASSAVDLHRFVPAGYTSSGAFGIDAAGRIVGYVGNESGRHAALWAPRWTPVYRCRDSKQKGNLLTTQGPEVEGLLTSSDAWVFDGTLCHVPPDSTDPNAMPVYRFGARDGAVRFYTIDPAERDRFFRDFRDAWAYEGIAFYAYRPSRRPPSAVAVHRFRSDSGGGYLYTRDERERANLREQGSGWTYEGISWYACE